MLKSEQLTQDLKQAMREKNVIALAVLREIRGEVLKIEKSGKQEVVSDEKFLLIVKKLIKEKNETIELAKQAQRMEVVVEEEQKMALFQKYLPESFTKEELIKFVEQAIMNTGASDMKAMGGVMNNFRELIANENKDADMKVVSTLIKEKLL